MRAAAASWLGGALLALPACGPAPPAPAPVASAGPPERVVVLGPSSAETLVWLGLAERIVGVSDYCEAPELAGCVRVGGQLDPRLEGIAALAPDLLVLQGAHPRLLAWADAQQVPVLRWKTQSVAAWFEEVRGYGRVFRCEERAAEQLRAWQAELTALSFAAPDEGLPSTAPRVLLIASRDPARVTRVLAAGRGSFLGELLHRAGGRNLFADHARDYFDLAEESLLRERPEVVLELGGAQTDAERLAIWRDAFPELPAVQAGRVHGLTGDFVFLPGPRMLETLRLLRGLIAGPAAARD